VPVCVAVCGGGEKLKALPHRRRQLTVTSPDFASSGARPTRFSCDGAKPDAVVSAVRDRAGGSGRLVGRHERR
jgi:hypothetical protein